MNQDRIAVCLSLSPPCSASYLEKIVVSCPQPPWDPRWERWDGQVEAYYGQFPTLQIHVCLSSTLATYSVTF